MAQRTHAGFTLVEVLVVTTILAMLMALIFPAAMSMASRGRRIQCSVHLKELAMACTQYENKNGWFPPLLTRSKLTPPTGYYSYVVPLLAELDKAHLSAMYTNGWLAFTDQGSPSQMDANQQSAAVVFQHAYIPGLVCPSDGLDNLLRPWLSYVVNAGREDNVVVRGRTDTAGLALDFRENGVFHVEDNGQTITDAPPPLPPNERCTSSFVRNHDGLKRTVLLTENIVRNAATYHDPRVWFKVHGTEGSLHQFDLGVHWDIVERIAYPNEYLDEIEPRGLTMGFVLPTRWVSRPASRHTGGYHVAWCDASVGFLSDRMDKFVFRLLLTPYGRGARNPSNGGPAPQHRLVSEAELAR